MRLEPKWCTLFTTMRSRIYIYTRIQTQHTYAKLFLASGFFRFSFSFPPVVWCAKSPSATHQDSMLVLVTHSFVLFFVFKSAMRFDHAQGTESMRQVEHMLICLHLIWSVRLYKRRIGRLNDKQQRGYLLKCNSIQDHNMVNWGPFRA